MALDDRVNSIIYNATNSTTDPYEAAYKARYENGTNGWGQGRIYFDSIDRNYTMNITIDGEMHTLQNVKIPSLWTTEYCFGNSVLDSQDMMDNPFCFSKPYFVW